MSRKITPEVQKILGPNEEDFQFVTSGAWKRIKQKLMNKLVVSDSVSSIDFNGKSDDQLLREIAGRAHATALIFEWMRDVENDSAIHKEAKQAMIDVREDIFLKLPESSDELISQQ